MNCEAKKIKPSRKKESNFHFTPRYAMPADNSLELFDVVCPSTGEPLFVDDESGDEVVAEGPEAAEARGGGGGGGDSADAEEGKTSTSMTSKRRRLTVPRGLAHADGTWHASVYVHLSRAKDGAFLLQKRSPRKDVCPSLWDLACAEHVASGESRVEAALRGLGEELGLGRGSVVIGAERLGGQLGPPRQAVLRIEGPPLVWDREVVTSYWLRDFFGKEEDKEEASSGGGGGGSSEKPGGGGGSSEEEKEKETIKFDEDEVSEVRWVLPAELKKEVEEHPERFTPWFLAELRARPELLLLPRGGG